MKSTTQKLSRLYFLASFKDRFGDDDGGFGFITTYTIGIFICRDTVCWSATLLALCSYITTTLFFSLLAQLFSLSVFFSLISDLPNFFSACLQCALLQSDHPPHLYLLRSACSISDILDYDCSAHALIWFLLSAWISSLIYSLSLFSMDLLIYLKITYQYVTHNLLLACTII